MTNGWDRMLKLALKLRNANIKFDWKIFTNSKKECDYEEIHFYKQRFDIWDYLADADYTVLLSDSEGLPYTVQESLQYQVPCIVTDIGGCTELIKDGLNGYVVPLSMEFDVNKLLKIPKLKEYDNHAKEKWLEYLGNGFYIDKEEEKLMKYLVEATDEYIKNSLSDAELGYIPKAGERWEVSRERMLLLTGTNQTNTKFVKVIKEIAPVENAIKEPKKETADKPTKRTPKKVTKK